MVLWGLPHPTHKLNLQLYNFYLFLLRKDQLKGCHFKTAAGVQDGLKIVLLMASRNIGRSK
jgi:hypothetical protein